MLSLILFLCSLQSLSRLSSEDGLMRLVFGVDFEKKKISLTRVAREERIFREIYTRKYFLPVNAYEELELEVDHYIKGVI